MIDPIKDLMIQTALRDGGNMDTHQNRISGHMKDKDRKAPTPEGMAARHYALYHGVPGPNPSHQVFPDAEIEVDDAPIDGDGNVAE